MSEQLQLAWAGPGDVGIIETGMGGAGRCRNNGNWHGRGRAMSEQLKLAWAGRGNVGTIATLFIQNGLLLWEVWCRAGGSLEKGHFRVTCVYFLRGSLLVME